MIILSKPGTELEKLLKKFYKQMKEEKKEAIRMMKEFTGVEPLGIGYYWVFGFTCNWSYDLACFPHDSEPKNMIVSKKNGTVGYRPNKRLGAVKSFIETWNNKFKGINGQCLSNYGIPVMDDRSGIYVNWRPILRNGRYGISAPSSLLDRMPKNENKQYEVEV